MELNLVYLVRMKDGTNAYFKIGKTNNFPRHFQKLQGDSAYKIESMRLYRTKRNTELKKYLHRKLSKYHYRGDWFKNVPIDFVDDLARKFIER